MLPVAVNVIVQDATPPAIKPPIEVALMAMLAAALPGFPSAPTALASMENGARLTMRPAVWGGKNARPAIMPLGTASYFQSVDNVRLPRLRIMPGLFQFARSLKPTVPVVYLAGDLCRMEQFPSKAI
jgi:hypothetical protein